MASTVGVAGEKQFGFPPFENREGWGSLDFSGISIWKIPTSPNIGEKWGTRHSVKCGDGVPQSGAVAGGIARSGRAERARLPIRKIAAQDDEAGAGECFGEGNQQRGLRVRARTMREDQGIAIWVVRDVEEAPDVGINCFIGEFANRGCGQEFILNRPEGWFIWRSMSVTGIFQQLADRLRPSDYYLLKLGPSQHPKRCRGVPSKLHVSAARSRPVYHWSARNCIRKLRPINCEM